MRRILFAALLSALAFDGPACAQSIDRPGTNLGGGFIEYLFTGGQIETEAPVSRGRRVGYGAAAYPVETGVDRWRRQRTAYAWPPAAPVERPRMAARFEPRLVDYAGDQKPGTIVIDTTERFLYLVESDGKAMRYGVGVGRPGFEWSGVEHITRMAEWPEWRPPAEMRLRRPDLPSVMAGGPDNPLGARALYLGSSLYRIHGSNEPHTIGQAVSSGCIRMRNEDVIDLYERVKVGTPVVVM
jgi:lipoprotein-anchoring transpeptidase ErfK/SrfK